MNFENIYNRLELHYQGYQQICQNHHQTIQQQ